MARRHSKMAVNLTLLNSTNASSEDYVYDYDIDDALYDFDWMELGPSLCVYSITFLAGILGNLLILVSVIRHTHVKSSPVNVFLASLATADLMLIVICLPLKVFKLFTYTWTLGLFNCKLLYFMQSVSAIGSVINLTALSFERYYAIVHPLKSQYLCTISKAKKTILVAWIAAFFLAIPVLFAQIHLEVGVRYKAYWCVRDIDNPAKWRAQELYLLLIILVIPSVVMSFCYGKIIREVCQVVRQRSNLTQNYGKPSLETEPPVRDQTEVKEDFTSVIERDSTEDDAIGEETSFSLRPPSYENAMASPLTQTSHFSSSQSNSSPTQSQGGRGRQERSGSSLKKVAAKVLSSVDHMGLCGRNSPKLDEETKQVVRMLISIVVLYIVCWGPLLIFNVMQSFGFIGKFLIGFPKYLKTAFSLMAYFNSCLNPIIYGFMSRNFRDSFMENLSLFCKCASREQTRRARNDSFGRSYSLRCPPVHSVAAIPKHVPSRPNYSVNVYTSPGNEYARNYTVTSELPSSTEAMM